MKLNGVRPHLSAHLSAHVSDLPASLDEGASDTVVFLLHGVGGGKEAWPDTMKALVEAGFRAVAWDMPGYGASPGITPYDNAGIARALCYACVGAPDTVRSLLREFIDMTKADELMITAQIFDHQARLRSFEIAAEL